MRCNRVAVVRPFPPFPPLPYFPFPELSGTFTVPYTSMNTSESESWKFGDLRVLQAAFKVLLLLAPIFPVFLRSGRGSCFMSSLILLCSSYCSSCFSLFSPSGSSFLYLHHIPHRECCTFFPGVERERLSCTTPFQLAVWPIPASRPLVLAKNPTVPLMVNDLLPFFDSLFFTRITL